MKKVLFAAVVTLAYLMGSQAHAQGTPEFFYCDYFGRPCINLNSNTANFGQISNIDSTSWGLGHGTSKTSRSKTALTWDVGGNVVVTAGFTASSITATSFSVGSLSVTGGSGASITYGLVAGSVTTNLAYLGPYINRSTFTNGGLFTAGNISITGIYVSSGTGVNAFSGSLSVTGAAGVSIKNIVIADGASVSSITLPSAAGGYGYNGSLSVIIPGVTGAYSEVRALSGESIARFANNAASYVNGNGGNFGVGIVGPIAKFSVKGAGGPPPTTGTDYSSALTNQNGVEANILMTGLYQTSPYGAWIQAADNRALGTTYPLILQPVGGLVGISTSAPFNPNSFDSMLAVAGANHACVSVTDMGDGTHRAMCSRDGRIEFFRNSTSDVDFGKAGTVGIGGAATSVIKLQVVQASAQDQPTLGTASGGFSLLGVGGGFGLYTGIANVGTAWLQSMRNDSATPFTLELQPRGGNVGVAVDVPVERLEVGGGIRNNKTKLSTEGGTLQMMVCETAMSSGTVVTSTGATVDYGVVVATATNDTPFGFIYGSTSTTTMGSCAAGNSAWVCTSGLCGAIYSGASCPRGSWAGTTMTGPNGTIECLSEPPGSSGNDRQVGHAVTAGADAMVWLMAHFR